MRISQGTKVVVALGLVIILCLAGCARPTPTPTPTPIPAPIPAPAPAPAPTGPYGELRYAASTFGGEKFDPIQGLLTETGVFRSGVLDFMFWLDEDGGLVSRVVEKWQMSPDGLSWMYYVRKGIKFHNGDDLTAKDVKFSIERYMLPASGYGNMRGMVDHVEIVDDYTVRIYTKGKQPFLPYSSYPQSPGQGVVQPKDYIERNGIEYFNLHPIGSGPFRFVRHVPGDLFQFEALDKHWRQVPAFKDLTIILMPEETTRVASIKTGVVDVADLTIESAITLEQVGYRTVWFASPQYCLIFPGALDPRAAKMPTSDVRVRQALSLAIDRGEIAKSLFYGKTTRLAPPYLCQLMTDIDFAYWAEYADRIYRYDPQEAGKLLKEAGYPDGFSIKLYSFSVAGLSSVSQVAQVIQGYWLKIGVRANVVPVDYGALTNMMWAGISRLSDEVVGQASPWSAGANPIAASRIKSAFHSADRGALLGRAFPEIDGLIDNAVSEMDPGKRKEILAKVIKTVVDMYVDVSVAAVPVSVVLGPRVDMKIPEVAFTVATGMYLEAAKHRQP